MTAAGEGRAACKQAPGPLTSELACSAPPPAPERCPAGGAAAGAAAPAPPRRQRPHALWEEGRRWEGGAWKLSAPPLRGRWARLLLGALDCPATFQAGCPAPPTPFQGPGWGAPCSACSRRESVACIRRSAGATTCSLLTSKAPVLPRAGLPLASAAGSAAAPEGMPCTTGGPGLSEGIASGWCQPQDVFKARHKSHLVKFRRVQCRHSAAGARRTKNTTGTTALGIPSVCVCMPCCKLSCSKPQRSPSAVASVRRPRRRRPAGGGA